MNVNYDAASLKALFEEAMEAKRTEIASRNGTLEITMQVLENILTSRHALNDVAMDKQLRFAIREGGRTVGSGVVTDIIE